MTIVPNLTWVLNRRRAPIRALLVLALLVVGAFALQHWGQQLHARLAAAERRLEQLDDRVVRKPGHDVDLRPKLAAAGARRVNEQIALLNRDWVDLLKHLSPKSNEVKLFAMDVNPATGAIRVVGGTASAEKANAYAERLQFHGAALHDVRLVLIERAEGKVKFEVTARWQD